MINCILSKKRPSSLPESLGHVTHKVRPHILAKTKMEIAFGFNIVDLLYATQ